MKEKVLTKGDSRGVFYDLFSEEEAAELTMRAQILDALQKWIEAQDMRQADIGKALGVPQPRISEIKAGNIGRFSLDKLVQMAQRAGLKPKLKIAA